MQSSEKLSLRDGRDGGIPPVPRKYAAPSTALLIEIHKTVVN